MRGGSNFFTPSGDKGIFRRVCHAAFGGTWSLDILRSNSRGSTLTRPAATLSPKGEGVIDGLEADFKVTNRRFMPTLTTAWDETSV